MILGVHIGDIVKMLNFINILDIGQNNWIMISKYYDLEERKRKGWLLKERVKEYTD